MPADRTPVVIDANVAIGLAHVNRLTAFARAHRLVAPPVFWSEVRSALHAAAASTSALDLHRATFARILDVDIDEVVLDDPFAPWDLATDRGWRKTYDAEYLCTAQQLDCPLVTVDSQLVRAARDLDVPLAPIV